MAPASMFQTWVVAAVVLFFLLVFGGTWYRIRHARRGHTQRYRRLVFIERATRWGRLAIILSALVAGGRVMLVGLHYRAALLGPCLWAGIAIVGLVGLDWLLLGLQPRPSGLSYQVRIRACLPWRPMVVLVLVLGVLGYIIYWAADTADIDQRSHVYSWVLDGVFGWGIRTPYPGLFYTRPFLYAYPAVVALAIAGVSLVVTRRPYVPLPKYVALDQGFRRRTARDIVLVCLGAASASLTLVAFTTAWAYGSLGPGSPPRTLIVTIAGVAGGLALGLSFWVIANLLILPEVEEDKALAQSVREVPVGETVPLATPELPAGVPRASAVPGTRVRRPAIPWPWSRPAPTPGEDVPTVAAVPVAVPAEEEPVLVETAPIVAVETPAGEEVATVPVPAKVRTKVRKKTAATKDVAAKPAEETVAVDTTAQETASAEIAAAEPVPEETAATKVPAAEAAPAEAAPAGPAPAEAVPSEAGSAEAVPSAVVETQPAEPVLAEATPATPAKPGRWPGIRWPWSRRTPSPEPAAKPAAEVSKTVPVAAGPGAAVPETPPEQAARRTGRRPKSATAPDTVPVEPAVPAGDTAGRTKTKPAGKTAAKTAQEKPAAEPRAETAEVHETATAARPAVETPPAKTRSRAGGAAATPETPVSPTTVAHPAPTPALRTHAATGKARAHAATGKSTGHGATDKPKSPAATDRPKAHAAPGRPKARPHKRTVTAPPAGTTKRPAPATPQPRKRHPASRAPAVHTRGPRAAVREPRAAVTAVIHKRPRHIKRRPPTRRARTHA